MDADFALLVPNWDSYRALIEAIVGAGHRRDPHIEHRVFVENVAIDIVPFGPGISTDGVHLTWPESGFLMDMTGFEEACEDAREIELAPGVPVRCVTLPAFVLLKIGAYLDRQRRGDEKHKSDAEDLLFWFRHYASGNDDGPRYDAIGKAPPDTLDYFTAGAAVLGRDVARLASAPARERVDQFVEHARPEESPFWSVLYRPGLFTEEIERALEDGRRMLDAFAWGMEHPGSR